MQPGEELLAGMLLGDSSRENLVAPRNTGEKRCSNLNNGTILPPIAKLSKGLCLACYDDQLPKNHRGQ